MWTPDVYEGAPTPVTAFFAVAPKIAAMALFLRVLIGPFGGMLAAVAADHRRHLDRCRWCSARFAAINQTNIKRLMAYSSIGHIGYALVGLAAGTPHGVRGVLIYMAIYLVMNIGTFACILRMRRQGTHGRGASTISPGSSQDQSDDGPGAGASSCSRWPASRRSPASSASSTSSSPRSRRAL